MRKFDYKYLYDKKWDNDILGYISAIQEFKGRQELFLSKKPGVLDNLVELAIIQSTKSSNKIEGIVTTDQRIRDLVLKKVTPKDGDEEEILGYQDVLNTIHESFEYIPITPSIILQLHRDLYRYSQKQIGGRFKNTQNYITETKSDGTRQDIFIPLEPHETSEAVEKICTNYNKAIDDGTISPLITVLIFVHDFLCIHPFNDGNGRMSRLLTTLLLYQLGHVVGRYISLEGKIEKTKNNYYDSLHISGIGWHENKEQPEPFIKYMLGIILSAYRDFEYRVDVYDQKLPAIEQVKLAVDRKIGKFTKSEIMEVCPAIGKASVENSLKKLVEDGVIARHGSGRNTFYTKK